MKSKKDLSLLSLFLVLLVCFSFFSCGKKIPQAVNWVADFEKAKQIAESKNKDMILEFHTDWCKWCKRLADSTFTDTSFIRFSVDFVFFKANAEKDTALAENYRVNGYPTVILANPKGKEIDRIVGYAPAPDFIKDINGYLRGEGTLADLENKLREDTTDIKLWFNVGEKYQERKRFDEAQFNFSKVISLDPKDTTGKASESLFNIGLLYMRQKDYPKAIVEFQKLIKDYPKSELRFDADEYIPYSYEKIGDTTKAIKLYRKMLVNYPDIEPSEKDWIETRIKKLQGIEEE